MPFPFPPGFTRLGKRALPDEEDANQEEEPVEEEPEPPATPPEREEQKLKKQERSREEAYFHRVGKGEAEAPDTREEPGKKSRAEDEDEKDNEANEEAPEEHTGKQEEEESKEEGSSVVGSVLEFCKFSRMFSQEPPGQVLPRHQDFSSVE